MCSWRVEDISLTIHLAITTLVVGSTVALLCITGLATILRVAIALLLLLLLRLLLVEAGAVWLAGVEGRSSWLERDSSASKNHRAQAGYCPYSIAAESVGRGCHPEQQDHLPKN